MEGSCPSSVVSTQPAIEVKELSLNKSDQHRHCDNGDPTCCRASYESSAALVCPPSIDTASSLSGTWKSRSTAHIFSDTQAECFVHHSCEQYDRSVDEYLSGLYKLNWLLADPREVEVNELLLKGIQCMADSDLEGAKQAYKRSLEIRETPAALYNLALA